MNDPTDNSEYLKIGDAARLLGVNKRTVYRRVWSGELPASKVGGLYFIRRDDLNALLEQGKFAKIEDHQPETTPLKCGFCYRLLDDSQVGRTCQEEGCIEVICDQCISAGDCYCAHHSPSRDERWKQAKAAFERGEMALLLKGGTARLREVNFLNRIQQRLCRVNTLVHPLSGEIITVPDWDACLDSGDERAEVLRLLGKVILDDVLIAQTPLNAWLSYRLPQPKGKSGLPLEVSVKVLSRLPELLRDGFDTRPLTADELTPWLLRLVDETQRGKFVHLALLASTTGWDDTARQVIQGGSGDSAFSHRQAFFYLFDLQSGELIYNQKDDRARPYAELFAPLLPSEELENLMISVENEIGIHQSLTLQQAEEALHQPPSVLKTVFERMVGTGQYEITEIPGLGLTILRH
jgi:excisionase family DNA binding protein